LAVVATGKGFEMEVPSTYITLKAEAEKDITALIKGHPKASKMWELLNSDPEVKADWDMSNYIAVAKLKFNDHGETHAKVVAANALKMLKLLNDNGVLTSIITEKAGEEDDVYLVVMAAGLLHDIGNQVHRENHHMAGVYLAIPLLNRLLPEVYDEPELMYEMRGHILHCIYSHEFEVADLTEEAALVGIADGTDMTKGRGRIAFDKGNVNIHTVSALSIDRVDIQQGSVVPIEVHIYMNNSAGIFQIQETLGKKISPGPLENYVEVLAITSPDEPSQDQRIIHKLVINGHKFLARN
jgi:metal-dependent HD superfamily phosphatase/phosphodiesterase